MLPDFKDAISLSGLVNAYFEYIKGVYHLEETFSTVDNEDDSISKKVWDREPNPATFSGLALFLGFSSLAEFKEYEQKGEFAKEINMARLRIEVAYEEMLHGKLYLGAKVALESMGQRDKTAAIAPTDKSSNTLKVDVFVTGPKPAENEQGVVL